MLVTSGATVEEIWDYKVDGKSLDNMLAICGQYVDFAPKYSPHFVCPAIVQQHRNFNFLPVSLSFLWQVKYEETKMSVELVSLSFFPHRQWWDEKISSSWRNDNRPKTDCFLLKKFLSTAMNITKCRRISSDDSRIIKCAASSQRGFLSLVYNKKAHAIWGPFVV